MSNPNPSGFATKGGGYVAFAHVALVRRDTSQRRTIVTVARGGEVALRMQDDEHAEFIAALTFWSSGA